jgi:hypothetical protein
MKMHELKMTTVQIRREIDAKYGRIGKPMPTPMPK